MAEKKKKDIIKIVKEIGLNHKELERILEEQPVNPGSQSPKKNNKSS